MEIAGTTYRTLVVLGMIFLFQKGFRTGFQGEQQTRLHTYTHAEEFGGDNKGGCRDTKSTTK